MNVLFQKPKNPWKPFGCSNQNPLKHTVYTFTTTTVMLPCHTNTIWAALARCDQPRGWRECHFGCLTSSEPTPHWISPALAQVFVWENHGYFMVISSGWWYTYRTYPSEKYESQLGLLFPVYGKIIHSCSKPPTSHGYVIVIQWDFAGTWYFFAFDEDHMEIVRHVMGEVGLSIWVLLFFWLLLLNPTIGMSTIDLMVGYMLIKSSKAATYLSRDPALYIYPIYLQRYNRYNMI